MADSLDSGSSAHYGRAGSSPASRTKKERHPHGCLSFLVQHFCYAKVVACGRVTEREWGNPSKVPPSHSPSLRWAGVQTTKHVGSHKRKETSERMSLFFWCGDFAARKPRPPAAALDMAPTPGQKRRRFCSPLTGVTSDSWDTPAGHRVYDACRGFSVSWVCRDSGASSASSTSC